MDEKTATEIRSTLDDMADSLEQLGDGLADASERRNAPRSESHSQPGAASEPEQDESFDPDAAIQELVSKHPNLRGSARSVPSEDNAYFVGYTVHGSPGDSALGNNRASAEEHVENKHGCTVNVDLIESNPPNRNGDLLLRVSLDPDE